MIEYDTSRGRAKSSLRAECRPHSNGSRVRRLVKTDFTAAGQPSGGLPSPARLRQPHRGRFSLLVTR